MSPLAGDAGGVSEVVATRLDMLVCSHAPRAAFHVYAPKICPFVGLLGKLSAIFISYVLII
jgi:hypothetical protein